MAEPARSLSPLLYSHKKPHSPRETPKAAAAFHAYCALGPDRSLSALTQQNQHYAKQLPQLKKWSAAHRWQDRVKEYDARIAEEQRKKRRAALEKMDEEHALIGRTQLLRAVSIIQEHINRGDTTLAGAVSLLRASYELERLARGAATERIEGDMTLTVLPKEYVGISEDEEGSEP